MFQNILSLEWQSQHHHILVLTKVRLAKNEKYCLHLKLTLTGQSHWVEYSIPGACYLPHAASGSVVSSCVVIGRGEVGTVVTNYKMIYGKE